MKRKKRSRSHRRGQRSRQWRQCGWMQMDADGWFCIWKRLWINDPVEARDVQSALTGNQGSSMKQLWISQRAVELFKNVQDAVGFLQLSSNFFRFLLFIRDHNSGRFEVKSCLMRPSLSRCGHIRTCPGFRRFSVLRVSGSLRNVWWLWRRVYYNVVVQHAEITSNHHINTTKNVT